MAPKSTFVQPQMPTKLVLQPKFEEVNTTAVTPVDNGKSAPQIEDGKLSMFWTDLCEVSGVLYLFGKVIIAITVFMDFFLKIKIKKFVNNRWQRTTVLAT